MQQKKIETMRWDQIPNGIAASVIVISGAVAVATGGFAICCLGKGFGTGLESFMPQRHPNICT